MAVGCLEKWKICVLLGFLLIGTSKSQEDQPPCYVPSPKPVEFSETHPPGLVLWNVTTQVGETWSFRVSKPAPSSPPTLEPYFRMEETLGEVTLYLNQTLNLEAVNNILQNTFILELSLTCNGNGGEDVSYTLFVTVAAVNEFAPEFVNVPESGFNVSEALKVSDTVLVLKDYVQDRDVVPNNPGFVFSLLPTENATVDGRTKFALQDSLTGTVVVRESLDYESMDPSQNFYILNVSVGDREGKTSTGTIRLNIIDADDQPPEFWYPGCQSPCFTSYSAAIGEDFQGEVTWLQPAAIAARDQDSLDNQVTYGFKKGNPENYGQYLTIDPTTGVPSIIKPVAESTAAAFVVIVEAVENAPLHHSEQTTLWLKVIGRNSSDPTLPPLIVDSDSSGEKAFRIAAIVLGVLFGLVLIVLVIFVVCSLGTSVRTMPVLGKAISKLSTTESRDDDAVSPRSSYVSEDVDRGKKKKSVKLRKSSDDSGVNFTRPFSRPTSSTESPALRSFSSIIEKDPDVENLPANGEIDYDQNGTADQQAEISTISTTELIPYEDHVGLMEDTGEMDQERVGVSNPAYKNEGEEESANVSVIPLEQAQITI